MKRTIMIVLAIAVALSMTACSALDALLSVNVFAPFAGVSASAIEKATPDELVEMSESESFYETLADDPELKDSVLATIEDAMDAEPASSASYQELAVLAANIELQTTPAGDLINNVGDLIGSLISGDTSSGGEEQDFGDMITSLMPPEVVAEDGTVNQEAFIDMINALDAANVYYEQLGLAIGDTGYAEGSDISAGDVAQAALVSALVSGITVPAGYEDTYPTTGDYLYALLTDSSGAVPESEMDMTALESVYMTNLLAAAGLDTLFADDSGV